MAIHVLVLLCRRHTLYGAKIVDITYDDRPKILCYTIDRVQASLRNKTSEWLDYIEFSTRLNQFEMFEEHETVYPDENNVVLDENSVEIKPCIDR